MEARKEHQALASTQNLRESLKTGAPMRPGIADLPAFRRLVEDALCGAGMDPRQARWITDLLQSMIKQHLPGKRIPSTSWFILQDNRAAAAALIHLGGTVAAKRLGCSRSQAYRRAKRHRDAA